MQITITPNIAQFERCVNSQDKVLNFYLSQTLKSVFQNKLMNSRKLYLSFQYLKLLFINFR